MSKSYCACEPGQKSGGAEPSREPQRGIGGNGPPPAVSIVCPNAVLAGSIARQLLKGDAGQGGQVLQILGAADLNQLTVSSLGDGRELSR